MRGSVVPMLLWLLRLSVSGAAAAVAIVTGIGFVISPVAVVMTVSTIPFPVIAFPTVILLVPFVVPAVAAIPVGSFVFAVIVLPSAALGIFFLLILIGPGVFVVVVVVVPATIPF